MQLLFVPTLSIVFSFFFISTIGNNNVLAASLGYSMADSGDPNANINIADILNNGLMIRVIDPSQVVTMESEYVSSHKTGNSQSPMTFTPIISPEEYDSIGNFNGKYEEAPPQYTDDNTMMMVESHWMGNMGNSFQNSYKNTEMSGFAAAPKPQYQTRQKRHHQWTSESERLEMIKANEILRNFMDSLVGIGTGLRVISTAAYRWLSPW